MDLIAFDQLIETDMKLTSRQRLEDLTEGRMIAHGEAKDVKTYQKALQETAGLEGSGADGNDLISDLSKAGNYK